MHSDLTIHMIDPKKLQPYFRNPRKNDETVLALVNMIPKVGFNVPIVVDTEMVIIKGHSRWNAARILELEEVPVIISEASDEQNDKDRILDNAIHDLTEWDYKGLRTEIDYTGLDLSNYRLSWIPKVVEVEREVKPETGKIEDIEISMNCPSCQKKLKYTKKELLNK